MEKAIKEVKQVRLVSEIEDIKERIQEIQKEMDSFDASEYIDECSYDDCLNDSYENVSIEGATLTPGEILKNCDAPAYREGFNNYIDSIDLYDIEEYRELEEEKERLESELYDLETELEELQ